nr:hypothetical protein [Enterococcus faecium]
MIAKNERGYKVVLRSGVLQLARNLDNQRLLDKLHKHEQNNDKNAYIPNKNVVANKLLDQLREENEFLREQLALKEQNNSHIQKTTRPATTTHPASQPTNRKTSGATAVDLYGRVFRE